MKKKQIFGIIFLVIGLLLIFTPNHIAPTCPPMEGGKVMKCHWMGQAVIAMGAVMTICSIAFLTVKNFAICKGISIANIAIGTITMLLPTVLIGTCKMHEMSCNVKTKPAVLAMAGVFVIANIAFLVMSRED